MAGLGIARPGVARLGKVWLGLAMHGEVIFRRLFSEFLNAGLGGER